MCWGCPAAGCSAYRILHRRKHQFCSCLCLTGSARATGGRCNGGRWPANTQILVTLSNQWWSCHVAVSVGSLSGELPTSKCPVYADNIAMACYLAVISFCPAENVPLRPAAAINTTPGTAAPFWIRRLMYTQQSGCMNTIGILERGTRKDAYLHLPIDKSVAASSSGEH